MNCWKSCNILRDYGSSRLLIVSILSSFAFFILFYLGYMDINHHVKLVSFNFLISFAIILGIWPLHKFLHYLPVKLAGKKVKLVFNQHHIIPVLNCDIPNAIPKWLSFLSVSFPVLIISGMSMLLAYCFPTQMHYFSIIGALNFGISISDLLYIIILFQAPAQSFVEDDHSNIKILIRSHQ